MTLTISPWMLWAVAWHCRQAVGVSGSSTGWTPVHLVRLQFHAAAVC